MLPLRWCSITSVYTLLSAALFLLFKCLSISLTQHSFTVSCIISELWSDRSTQAGSAGSNGECHHPPFPTSGMRHLRHCNVCAVTDTQHRHAQNYNGTHSGQRGDGLRVGAVSIIVDIVCHHHNGMGLRNMPAREKNKSTQMEEACLSVPIFCRHFLMKTNYPLSGRH